jgi:hypothetical protein
MSSAIILIDFCIHSAYYPALDKKIVHDCIRKALLNF